MGRQVITLYGPPGTGKTTAEISIVDRFLRDGGRPERVAYSTFTRKAANEAADRAGAKFGLAAADLPYFRTLHSLAYHQRNLTKDSVMQPADWRDFGKLTGYEFTEGLKPGAERMDAVGGKVADRLLQLYTLARARNHSVEHEWRLGSAGDMPLWAAVQFGQNLDEFKARELKLDFTDFMAYDPEPMPVDLFILDEAQDLTPQQWKYARALAKQAATVVVAGDDDQAIYNWAGADSAMLSRFTGTHIVLPKSFRMPRKIFDLAVSISSKIQRRVPKEFAPREEQGEIEYVTDIDHVDLSTGSWLVLARQRRTLDIAERACRQNGFVYQREGEWSNQDPTVRAVVLYERLRRGESITLFEARTVAGHIIDMVRPTYGDEVSWSDMPWHGPATAGREVPWFEALTRLGSYEIAYIRALLRSGESPTKPGRIVLSTIHGSKGGEADNVLLFNGITKRVREEAELDPDAEARVWYVAVSRAKQRLIIAETGNLRVDGLLGSR